MKLGITWNTTNNRYTWDPKITCTLTPTQRRIIAHHERLHLKHLKHITPVAKVRALIEIDNFERGVENV